MNNHKQPIFEPPGWGPEEHSWNVPEIAPKLLLPGTEERRKSADSGEAEAQIAERWARRKNGDLWGYDGDIAGIYIMGKNG